MNVMNPTRTRFATLLGFSLLLSCAPALVSMRRGPRTYTAQAYNEVRTRWTRAGRGFSLQGFLDDQLMVTATYESWDFRWAYVVRYAADFRLSSEDRTRLLQTSLDASQREHEFYVAVQVPNRRWGDLAAPSSGWRVLLVNDQQREVLPIAIEAVRQPGALERTYFPYTTVWRQVFRIRFPARVDARGEGSEWFINGNTRYFTLRFAGPIGGLDLVWNVGD
jgi:hypothetical protein